LTTPYQAPKANAICERFLGSVRRECLDFFLTLLGLILSERHLYRTMKQYQAYFNHARPHQGINQQIPCPAEQAEEQATEGEIISHPVLGGLHHDYQRALARPRSLALPEYLESGESQIGEGLRISGVLRLFGSRGKRTDPSHFLEKG